MNGRIAGEAAQGALESLLPRGGGKLEGLAPNAQLGHTGTCRTLVGGRARVLAHADDGELRCHARARERDHARRKAFAQA